MMASAMGRDVAERSKVSPAPESVETALANWSD
jgi:hypothetical protein